MLWLPPIFTPPVSHIPQNHFPVCLSWRECESTWSLKFPRYPPELCLSWPLGTMYSGVTWFLYVSFFPLVDVDEKYQILELCRNSKPVHKHTIQEYHLSMVNHDNCLHILWYISRSSSVIISGWHTYRYVPIVILVQFLQRWVPQLRFIKSTSPKSWRDFFEILCYGWGVLPICSFWNQCYLKKGLPRGGSPIEDHQKRIPKGHPLGNAI